MQLTVKLYATLSDYLPASAKNNRVALEVPENVTVNEVLAPFSIPPKLAHLVLVNGVYIEPAARASTPLKADDTLAVWPPIAGG